jgi:hypothetical protein
MGFRNLSKIERLLAAATAHHRLLWLHPFLDGNGRVARIMSDAMLRTALDSHGLWSVTRGLARRETRYKELLAACDMPRRNDLDGAGSLSEEALVAFTIFFLETALDQVDYMRSMVQPKRIETRVKLLVQEEIAAAGLSPFAEQIALHPLLYGDSPVERLFAIAGDNREEAERAVNHLAGTTGLIKLRDGWASLALPIRQLPRLMPGLFPEDE